MKSFFKKHWLDLLLIFLILGSAPLFFYKLGQSSLVSWDEAWYAGIAQNMVQSGDIMTLRWNGSPFFDHPVSGFWWIASSFKIFGISNFSARLPSAVFGMLTLVFVFLLGKQLFNRWVGFASAVALLSAPWFLYRSRTGDLDVFLTFFFVLSIFLSVKSVSDRKFFIPLGISLALLFLTKTMVPLTIIPALFVIYFGQKVKISDLFRTFITFLIPTGVWVLTQFSVNMNFIHRYFDIGLPGVSVKNSYLANLQLFKGYLHNGIAKWFWPGVFSVFASLFVGKRSFYILSVLCLSFSAPFLFSARTQMWHLIPLYPFMILSFFGLAYFIAEKVTKNKYLPAIGVIAVSLYFTITLGKAQWYQFIDIPAYISDEEILSREAGKHPGPFFVDGDFIPTALFYSRKDKVFKTSVGGIKDALKTENSLLMIATQNRLNDEGIKPNQYKVLMTNRDKLLIIKE